MLEHSKNRNEIHKLFMIKVKEMEQNSIFKKIMENNITEQPKIQERSRESTLSSRDSSGILQDYIPKDVKIITDKLFGVKSEKIDLETSDNF